jgi:sensor histidine kinase YesM
MTSDSRSERPGRGISARYSLFLFIFALGLLIRLPLYSDKAIGATFSLLIDAILILLFLPFSVLIDRATFVRVNAAMICLVVLGAMVGSAIMLVISWSITTIEPAFLNRFHTNLLGAFPYFLILYALLGLTALWEKGWRMAVESTLRATSAEQRLIEAELKRLRGQLDPHFLFNTLNMTLIEINNRPKRATQLIGELSGYLRYSLDTAHVAFAPLSSELAMVRSYLRIQSVRFGARLVSRLDVAPAARRVLVPTFLLQPLVENAIKYGIPGDDMVLRVAISIEVEDGDLRIEARNGGDLRVTPDPGRGTGVGLANLRARLALHYPDRHALSIAQQDEDVVVTIRLRGEPC